MRFSNLAQLLRGRADQVDHQPRVPKGQHGGGQWTRLEDLAGAQTEEAEDRPRETDAQNDRPDDWRLARMDRGDFNTIVQSRPRIGSGLNPWLSAYEVQSALDRRGERQTVIQFSADEFEAGEVGTFALERSEQLDWEKASQRCRQLQSAYDVALEAEKAARNRFENEGRPVRQPQFGTAVHVEAANLVREKYSHLHAEMSFWDGNKPITRKQYEDMNGGAKATNPPYGTKGSIRTDLLEEVQPDTICVYDIKTGREPLGTARIAQIMQSVAAYYRERGTSLKLKRIIITTVHVPSAR